MTGKSGEGARPTPRRWVRWLLWLHAILWALFALGMIAVAFMSAEARGHPVFVQVLIACSLAATAACSGDAESRPRSAACSVG